MQNENPEPQKDPTAISEDELVRRLVYSLLFPAARLAKQFRLPLKEMTAWLQLAYFQEVRRSGLTLKQASELLNVGMRKASELSKNLKDNFFDPEREYGLPRRVEFMVWGESLSRARLYQLIREESESDIDSAIQRLINERRIVEAEDKPDVFAASSPEARLYTPQWMAQIDGVNNFMASTLSATFARVIRRSPTSLLRTLNFRIRPSDIEKLNEFYETELFPKLASLEQDAVGDPDAITMDLSICWAPSGAQSEDN